MPRSTALPSPESIVPGVVEGAQTLVAFSTKLAGALAVTGELETKPLTLAEVTRK